MLSLFKEEGPPLALAEALPLVKSLLASSLNKGLIPSWDELCRELPTLEGPVLTEVHDYFLKLTSWPFLRDALVGEATEFFFHGPKSCQRALLKGGKEEFSLHLDEADWQLWLELLSVHFQQNWNVQSPFVSFYGELFGSRYRISLLHASTSPLNRSKLVLRSLAPVPHSLASFGETSILEELVRTKKNFVIAGSTGSGKTSLLTSLLALIDPSDHLVVLEDTYEILSRHPHETRFLAGEGPATSLKSYLAYSLRLSPDRIVLGEMRSHEVVPFLMAMNTGHRGLMGTLHASSAVDAINRLALLFCLYGAEAGVGLPRVVELICRNLEYVVFMENKRVKEVIRILGADQGVPFFELVSSVNNQGPGLSERGPSGFNW